MVVHSQAVIIILLSLFPESFGIFFFKNVKFWVEPQGFLKIQILRPKMLLNRKLSLALPVSKFLKLKVAFLSKTL